MTRLTAISNVVISHAPTPLEKLTNLSAALGVNIFVKRDDCTGLAGGGNKTRKLEYLLADAQNLGADTLVTIGGIQSNHARQTAAAAAKFSMGCELVLEDVEGTPKQDYYQNGNALINRLCHANTHLVPEGSTMDECVEQLLNKLNKQGKKPYFIPMGGSNELGSLGYVECAREIVQQTQQQDLSLDHIVVATGSGGTQAGLLAGFIAQKQTTPVLGICVSRSGAEQQHIVEPLLQQTLALLDLDRDLGIGHVHANGNYYGAGYGITTEQTREAIKRVAALEGILLDPVYTGKAMAGLIDLCEQGEFAQGQNILFIHTGGSQGLFAYQQEF